MQSKWKKTTDKPLPLQRLEETITTNQSLQQRAIKHINMKKILLIILFAIIAQSGFSQQSASKEVPLNVVQTEEIIKLQNQVETLQKELITTKEECIKALSHSEEHFKYYQSSVGWGVGIIGVLFAIMVGLFGLLLPYLNNKNNQREIDRKMEDIATSLSAVKKDVEIVEQLKKEVEDLKTKAKESEEKAKESAAEAEASKLFAEAYNEKDNNNKIELYTKVIQLDPNNSAAYNNRGIVYRKLLNFDKALEDYTKAIEIDHKDVDAYFNRGNTYRKLSNFDKAIEDYTIAIEIDPKHASAYNNRANIYLKTKKYEEALRDINIALQHVGNDNDKALCLDTRAEVYHEMGEYEKSLADYSEAISLNPKLWESYYKRGLTYQAISVTPETPTEKQEEYANLAEQDFKIAADNGYKPEE